ncbi:hypothetical protein CTI12_AA237220 [Artemisia annua]|uniref:Translation elongation factor EF1B beta/delta subunit guanine nucleotide exchange domain-containing protein n=1 Tax=Artemisia annua TaxID=35608 RepID=A0A2U1M6W7_ARTAN|nr:hypothetical protein CTI12_AA237220 [Artemisia annua]
MPSIFDSTSDDKAGRPKFNRFTNTDGMKAVPPPLTDDYTPMSDYSDLDESQMSYGTKSSTSSDSNSMSNDFVSCDNSDKSSKVNVPAPSAFSVKSSESNSTKSTFYASNSSVSTSKSKTEIESKVRAPKQEPIVVQDLPSFTCNKSDKNSYNSRTSCNKNAMPPTFYVGSQAGLNQLEERLLSQSYRAARTYITGYHASKDDLTVHAAFTNPPSPQYVNILVSLVMVVVSFVDTSASFPEDAVADPAPTKYFVVLDVSPLSGETDIQRLEEEVRRVQIEGLEWGEYGSVFANFSTFSAIAVPIGYGIFKLRFKLTIVVGEEVCLDALIEERFSEEPVKDYVQRLHVVVRRRIRKHASFPVIC